MSCAWSPEQVKQESAKIRFLHFRADSCEWVNTALRLVNLGCPLTKAFWLAYEQLQRASEALSILAPDLEDWTLPVREEGEVDVERLLLASVWLEWMHAAALKLCRKAAGITW